MSVEGYTDLKHHIGHKVVVAYYGDRKEPSNVAIECETCYVVLLDFDHPDAVASDDDDEEDEEDA